MSLGRKKQQHEAKLAALQAAIDEGDSSGISEGDVFARVREKLKIPATGSRIRFPHRAEA